MCCIHVTSYLHQDQERFDNLWVVGSSMTDPKYNFSLKNVKYALPQFKSSAIKKK